MLFAGFCGSGVWVMFVGVSGCGCSVAVAVTALSLAVTQKSSALMCDFKSGRSLPEDEDTVVVGPLSILIGII